MMTGEEERPVQSRAAIAAMTPFVDPYRFEMLEKLKPVGYVRREERGKMIISNYPPEELGKP